MLTISRVLLGWYGLKSPGFFSGLEPSLPMPRPTRFELFLAFSHGPLSMPQKASEHSLAEDTVSEWLRRWTRNPLGSARKGPNPFGVDVCACCLCPWPKTGKLEEAVGHQPPAHAHNFSCLAGVVWAKKPWVLQWPRALSAHAPPHKFRTFPCLQPWASEHATESF